MKKVDGFKDLEGNNNENLLKLSKLYKLRLANEDGEYIGKDQHDSPKDNM